MNFKKGTIVALAMLVGIVGFAAAASTDKEGSCPMSADKKVSKCKESKDNAVKHCKTPKGEAVCPVAIWAAETVGPDGNVIDEAVMIWELSDGSTWIAKKVKPAAKDSAKAVTTESGKKVEPMTMNEAKMDESKPAMDMVKCAASCPAKGTRACPAKEHVKSVDGKAVTCSKLDVKGQNSAPNTAKDEVTEDACFIVLED